MDLSDYQTLFLPAIEARLIADLHARLDNAYRELKDTIFYHFGVTDQQERMKGKRIRPLLVLLIAEVLDIEWQSVLPAASAVEMLHNFSLIHDDIEDHSSTRRGKTTVWKKWGVEKAINIGDVLFSMAVQTIQSRELTFHTTAILESARHFAHTAFDLLQGQQMDMDFEGNATIAAQNYLQMIAAKTGALLAYCCEVSALLAERDRGVQDHLRTVGLNLGLSFQIYDDWLGIWGDERQTGKPRYSDLLEHKISYPVLLGLAENAGFRELWLEGKYGSQEAQRMAELLVESGIDAEVLAKSEEYNNIAITALDEVSGNRDAKNALQKLMKDLVRRKK
jgi:geranylgeranyl diphosphate synthase type I